MKKEFKGQYKDEKLLFKGHEHWLSFVIDKTHLLAIFIVLAIIFGIVLYYITDITLLLFLPIIIFILFFVFYIRYLYSNTWIIITSRRVIELMQNNLFHKHRKELKLQDIKASESQRGFWGMIFGFGEISVKGTEEDSNIYFKGIQENDAIANYIGRVIDYIKLNGHTDNISRYQPVNERETGKI